VQSTHKERLAARAHLSRRQGPHASWLPSNPRDDVTIAARADYETWVECRRCHRTWRADIALPGVLHHYVDLCERCEVTLMQTTGTFPALSQPRPKGKPKSGGKKR
jgi:hypothetical protein